MATPLGNECRLYYANAGGLVNRNLITKVEDVTLELDSTEIDQTTRDDGGWRAKRSGLRQWGCNFRKLYDPADVSFGILKAAFVAGTSIGVAILDAPDPGGLGISGNAYVTKFTRGEPMDDVVRVEVTLVGNGQPTVD